MGPQILLISQTKLKAYTTINQNVDEALLTSCIFIGQDIHLQTLIGTRGYEYYTKLVYDNQTVETAWSSGGGALSGYFSKPTYQNSLNVVRRSVPDIAMNADPATGVAFLVNNSLYIYSFKLHCHSLIPIK